MVVAAVMVLILLIWCGNVKLRKNLIMTPSSHKQVTFLDVKEICQSEDFTVEFCLYDEECDAIQFCFRTSRNHQAFVFQPDEMYVFVDGCKKSDGLYEIGYTAWFSKYYIFILENIPEFSSVRLKYENSEFEAYWPATQDSFHKQSILK